jgi:hypothetical protein
MLDKTFCINWASCKNGENCDRALTKRIEAIARNTGKNLSMCHFTECWEQTEDIHERSTEM